MCWITNSASTSILTVFGSSDENVLTFIPPESALSGQFLGIYAKIGGVRVNSNVTSRAK